MEYKKNFFFMLEKIEQKKIEQNAINIKAFFLREKQNIKQLNILINYHKEYLKKMHEEMQSGISIHAWKNYNNFIFILDKTIQKNLYLIENNKKIIKENLNNWSHNRKKLNIWINFNKIYIKKISKIKKIQAQIMNDTFVQLKYFQKDNYSNVRYDEQYNISKKYS